MQGRSLGIDFGLARIGLAMSDPTGVLASALETLNWNGEDEAWVLRRIEELCRLHGVRRIVLGLPKRTDGKGGAAEEKARRFGAELGARCGLPVIFQDERYTTVLAARTLRASSVKPGKKRGLIDQVAAEIILQSYLDAQR